MRSTKRETKNPTVGNENHRQHNRPVLAKHGQYAEYNIYTAMLAIITDNAVRVCKQTNEVIITTNK